MNWAVEREADQLNIDGTDSRCTMHALCSTGPFTWRRGMTGHLLRGRQSQLEPIR